MFSIPKFTLALSVSATCPKFVRTPKFLRPKFFASSVLLVILLGSEHWEGRVGGIQVIRIREKDKLTQNQILSRKFYRMY